MIGKTGKALQDFTDNSGQIRVAGAIWSAKIAETTHVQSSDLVTVQSGDLVTVQSIDGLTLTITKNT